MDSTKGKLRPFGFLAFQMNFANKEQIQECLQIQKEQQKGGNAKRLGEIMLAQGYLDNEQMEQILQQQKLQAIFCKKCQETSNYPIDTTPTHCRLCGSLLADQSAEGSFQDAESEEVEVEEIEEIEEIEGEESAQAILIEEEGADKPIQIAAEETEETEKPLQINADEAEEEAEKNAYAPEQAWGTKSQPQEPSALLDAVPIDLEALDEESEESLSGDGMPLPDFPFGEILDAEPSQEKPLLQVQKENLAPEEKAEAWNFAQDLFSPALPPLEKENLPLLPASDLVENDPAASEIPATMPWNMPEPEEQDHASEKDAPSQNPSAKNDVALDLDFLKHNENFFFEEKLKPQSSEKPFRPSDTFGLIPLGDAIAFEEKEAKTGFPALEKSSKKGLQDLFGDEPTAATKEWNLSEMPPLDDGLAQAEDEIGSDFFRPMDDTNVARIGDKKKKEALSVPLPPIQNPEPTMAEEDLPPSFPRASGTSEGRAGSAKKAPSKNTFDRGKLESEVPATSPLGGYAGPFEEESEEEEAPREKPGKKLGRKPERAAKETDAPKRPKLSRRPGKIQERLSGRRKVIPAPKDNKMVWNTIVVCILVLLAILLAVFFKTPSLRGTKPKALKIKKTEASESIEVAQKEKEDSKKKIQLSAIEKENLYREALQLHGQKQYEEALVKLTRILDEENNYQQARYYRADSLYQLGKIAPALEEVNSVLEKDATAESFLLRGKCLERQKEYPKALEAYDRALGIQPDLIEPLQGKARIERIQGNFVKAMEYTQIGVRRNSPTAQSDLNTLRLEITKQCNEMIEKGENEKLRVFLEPIIGLDPWTEYTIYLAYVYYETNPQKALQYLDTFGNFLAENNIKNHPMQERCRDLWLYCCYKLKKTEVLEKIVPGEMQQIYGMIPLEILLTKIVVCQQQKKTKQAWALYYVMNRILGARVMLSKVDKNFLSLGLMLSSPLTKLATELREEIGFTLEKKIPAKYLSSVIQIQLRVTQAADSLALRTNDVLWKLNGEEFYTVEELILAVSTGSLQKLTIRRQEETLDLSRPDVPMEIFQQIRIGHHLRFLK